MKVCKHLGEKITSYTAPPPLPGTWRDPALDQFGTVQECSICCDCGEWLSLGPANDADKQMQIEEAAAAAEDSDGSKSVRSRWRKSALRRGRRRSRRLRDPETHLTFED